MDIRQGDVYWLQLDSPDGSEPGIPHPHVVISDGAAETVTVCAVTSNVRRAAWPGNVLLDVDEANLMRPSVVEVSKVLTVDKARLGEYIGTLTEARVAQILAGIRFLQTSFRDR